MQKLEQIKWLRFLAIKVACLKRAVLIYVALNSKFLVPTELRLSSIPSGRAQIDAMLSKMKTLQRNAVSMAEN